jgi:hypothetical protein
MFGWDDVVGAALKIVDKIIPDPTAKAEAQLKILQLQQAGDFKELEARMQEMQMQADINKVEAASSSVFVSGARPFLMWVGGVGLAYQWLVVPLFSFAYTMYTGHDVPVIPPKMDPDLLVLVGSLMGIHIGVRSYEKVKGVA